MLPPALHRLVDRLDARRADGLQRARRTVDGPCGPRQATSPAEGGAPAPLLSFCSNDYLGLAGHPAIVEALREGARLHGAGSGASALITGHGIAHAALEAELATYMAPVIPGAAALHFGTGYLANLAVTTSLGSADTTLFCDALNHASLIDGARLARAGVVVYPHADVLALDTQLAACATSGKVIVTDGVFSMDGDVAPLAALLALAERHDALLVVDDAHGFGVLGPAGRGAAAAAQLRSERLVAVGTLGKAAGVAGAFVAAHPVVIDWLVQTGRSYIYTTAAPPALAHAVSASLRLIEGDFGERARSRLQTLVGRLRDALPEAVAGTGWRLLDSSTPVQALLIGGSDATCAVSAALERQGVRVPAIRPPTVAPGSARLRIALSAAHTDGDMARLIGAVRSAVRDR